MRRPGVGGDSCSAALSFSQARCRLRAIPLLRRNRTRAARLPSVESLRSRATSKCSEPAARPGCPSGGSIPRSAPATALRTDALSRSLLFVQPESYVRVDQNTTITLNQTTDEIEVQFFAAELAVELRNTQSSGAGYFITRFPKKFKVTTPHMNAAVEGTEFMVETSSDATKLTVLEGKVSSESVATRDAQLVTAGQSLESGATGPAAITAVVKPQDAVQWVLRYPPISDGSNASRAEELLRAGSVDEALAEIDSVLRGDPGNSDAHALRAIIQVAKNDKAGALESAARRRRPMQGTIAPGWRCRMRSRRVSISRRRLKVR